MRKKVAGLAAVASVVFCSLALMAATHPARMQDKQQTQAKTPAAQAGAAPIFVIPADAAKKANPVKATSDSIEEGKKLYGYDCAMCHGTTGDGKGDLAGDMKLQMKDLRNADTLKEYSDGAIFYIIQKGGGQMKGEGDRQPADSIWNMVNYVRTLAKKPAAGGTK